MMDENWMKTERFLTIIYFYTFGDYIIVYNHCSNL